MQPTSENSIASASLTHTDQRQRYVRRVKREHYTACAIRILFYLGSMFAFGMLLQSNINRRDEFSFSATPTPTSLAEPTRKLIHDIKCTFYKATHCYDDDDNAWFDDHPIYDCDSKCWHYQ